MLNITPLSFFASPDQKKTAIPSWESGLHDLDSSSPELWHPDRILPVAKKAPAFLNQMEWIFFQPFRASIAGNIRIERAFCQLIFEKLDVPFQADDQFLLPGGGFFCEGDRVKVEARSVVMRGIRFY
jgi:hypothetical protein